MGMLLLPARDTDELVMDRTRDHRSDFEGTPSPASMNIYSRLRGSLSNVAQAINCSKLKPAK